MKKIASKSSEQVTKSILPFDVDSLTQGIRVKPAVFARMMSVSKQAVSQWIKAGKITLFHDGTLDPRKAAQQVIDNSDPARMRAKVFKLDADNAAANREKIEYLEAKVGELNENLKEATLRIEYLNSLLEECGEAEHQLHAILLVEIPKLKGVASDQLPKLIDAFFDKAVIAADRALGLTVYE